jgi:vanillate/3-O-methylgallate O-demethylase
MRGFIVIRYPDTRIIADRLAGYRSEANTRFPVAAGDRLRKERAMKSRSLEELLRATADPVAMLRNSPVGAYVYPVVPSEYSNWRDEQRAWRETAVLFDQSHHMAEQYLEGPDALKLVAHLGTNSFTSFPAGRAKHYCPCSYSGHVIGDGILFHLEPNRLVFVGRAPAANWLRFHAETGGYDVTTLRDERSPSNPGGREVIRRNYRFQIQGPNAWPIIERLNGGPVPEIRFFDMGSIRIAGREVRALRHGMAGAPGLEIWGPYAERDEIRAAIVEAGRDHGLRECGSRAYATNTLESGWIPSPLPAVYTDARMQSYREWLPATGYEGTGSLAGSFVSDDIEDYYLTPYELGYGIFVRFDHDYIGREALEARAGQPHRRKVTLAWNREDVLGIHASLLEAGQACKYLDWPLSNYGSASYDRVVLGDRTVGVSMFAGYSYNERSFLSLAVVDPQVALGTEVRLIWGEEGGGTAKATVERHRQTEIRAVVSPVPYAETARTGYAPGWRSSGG